MQKKQHFELLKLIENEKKLPKIAELLKLTEEELSNIKNLGKKSIEDIAEKLRNWKEKHQDQNQENESNLGEGE